MKKRKFTYIVTVYGLLLMLLLCTCVKITVHAEKDNKEKIRAGFYQFGGYHEMNSAGEMSGYGYDFLQLIAGYEDFQYEYVGYDKTWTDMLQMLEDGEIDMVTSAQYTDERAERFEYSECPIGYSEAILTTKPEQDKIYAGEYDSYNQMRVGMLKGSSQNEKMFQFAKKHQFTFQPVYFNTLAEMEKALSEGTEVDALVTSSIRMLGDEQVLERFERAPYYVIVKKGNTELMDKINYAINELNDDYPSWSSDLYNKYYSANDTYLLLETAEREYLDMLKKSNKTLEVLINPDLKPYSYFENKQAEGILVNYFNRICEMYGLKAHYIQVDTSEEYNQLILTKSADIVLAPNFSKYEADHDGYYLTNSFLDAPLCMITRVEMNSNSEFADRKIAVVSGMSSVVQAVSNELENAELISYPTMDRCVQAVKDGEVDGAFLYVYSAYRYLNHDWTNEIQLMNISNSTITFSIAMTKEQNALLYSLLSHGIRSISENELQSIVMPYILKANQVEEPLWVYIYHKPVLFTTLVSIGGLLIITMILLGNKKHNAMLKAKREKAEYEATHDALTGALNRTVYKSLIDKTFACADKVGVLYLDVDYFKEINDTYGHEMGDQVLQHFVTLLQSMFREEDLIIRMGGDEFVLVLQNCEQSAWERICEKLGSVHDRLVHIFPGNMGLTISGGVCFSENGIDENIFKRADAALYHTKKEGRAGCTLVDKYGIIVDHWKEEKSNNSFSQILEQHQLNTWKMIIDEEGIHKLYAQDILYNYLRISKDTLPEIVYDRWYKQIEDDQKELFEQLLLGMKQGNTVEIAVSCRHLEKGSIKVRVGGRKLQQKDEIDTYAGYYQIMNDIHVLTAE